MPCKKSVSLACVNNSQELKNVLKSDCMMDRLKIRSLRKQMTQFAMLSHLNMETVFRSKLQPNIIMTPWAGAFRRQHSGLNAVKGETEESASLSPS